ncbi:hypothetical protein [Paraburkholderia rhynchosiae]|uniref:Lipoprotein n=1 Tax=Paraburkholderia rhynchosiae TaxID=487049 RepID=A0A2N7WXZ8_9BURK|nr:hypothetical protein [Paraburkholderia rhynchosiae]PMS34247.1 hypothetical protein C0Z16_01420 [Paraburkholderia rhynchosiae]CAB3638081.1 hypothetical protein LMG27174_00281 [Paraburkholderia rhynchosiae]
MTYPRRLIFFAPLTMLAACSVVATPYSPSVENIQTLKNASPVHARIGDFQSQDGGSNRYPVPVRANVMRSPVGKSFADYLSNAVTQELTLAGTLSPSASVELDGILLENSVDVGIGTGVGTMSARFVVKRNDAVRYDQVKTVRGEWDSSFAAAIAVPRATQQYPLIVQKLLGALYSDPAFISAIR